MILNRAKDYYKNDKDQKSKLNRHWNKYQKLSKEEQNKKREYGREEKKQRKETKINRISKLLPWDKKINKIKIFDLFSFHYIKHGTRSCVFRRKWHY